MNFIVAILLGIIEGITEFLPISSTGHLIIANQWLSLPPNLEKTFDVVIQLGAILAIVVLFWRRLLDLARRLPSDGRARRLVVTLAVAFVPLGVLGLLFNRLVEEELFNPVSVAIALIVGGIVMLLVDTPNRRGVVKDLEDVTPTTGGIIGLWQALALFPGTSRSAATIVGGMLAGLDRRAAVEFSFLLSIPTMFVATGYSLVKSVRGLTSNDLALIGVGFVTAFITAYIVVRWFLGYVSTHNLRPFALYRLALGVLILALFWLGVVR